MLVLIMIPAIYSMYFQVNQQLIHWKMWSMADEEANDVVVIHPSKLYWMEKDREIFVNGLMFDVKSIEKVGDSLRITGEFDYEESNLVKKLESIEEEQKKDGRQANAIQMLVQIMDDSMSRFQTTYIDLVSAQAWLRIFQPSISSTTNTFSLIPFHLNPILIWTYIIIKVDRKSFRPRQVHFY